MAVTNGWGQGVENNTIDWGKGSTNNSNNWGSVYGSSAAGDTLLSAASFSNTKSLDFDGVDDFVSIGNPTNLQITGLFTFSAWIKTPSAASYDAIFFKGNSIAQSDWYIRMQNNGTIRFFINNTSKKVTSSSTIDDNNWHHLLIIYSPSTSMTIYIDGVQDAQNTSAIPSSINNNYGNITIGSDNDISQFWNGNIDEVGLWNSDQSSNISTIYNSGNPSDLTSLNPLAWWRFEEGSGTTATDSGSGGNDGTLTNGVAYSTDVPT